MQSNFVTVTMEKSFCRTCRERVTLLVNEDLHQVAVVSFFICWKCKTVSEVGVGLCVDKTPEEVRNESR